MVYFIRCLPPFPSSVKRSRYAAGRGQFAVLRATGTCPLRRPTARRYLAAGPLYYVPYGSARRLVRYSRPTDRQLSTLQYRRCSCTRRYMPTTLTARFTSCDLLCTVGLSKSRGFVFRDLSVNKRPRRPRGGRGRAQGARAEERRGAEGGGEKKGKKIVLKRAGALWNN